jgi:hypothetical protein
MKPPTRDELLAELRRQATPLDLDALVAEGVLRKVRGSYEVLDIARFPEHARSRATTVTTQKRPDGTQRVLLKFSNSNGAARLLKRLTGEEPPRP